MFEEFKYFEVKPEHIKLLSKMWVSWESGEFGAPAIDCKRPYGNSYVIGDIAEILGLQPQTDEYGEVTFSEAQEEFMNEIHKETQTALQVCLTTLSFVPGLYKSERFGNNWERVE
jgi:hypothetical protein